MTINEISKVALAIGNKLLENKISISLTLAGELAETAIKAMKNDQNNK